MAGFARSVSSNAESSVILDSILTYYTDTSTRQPADEVSVMTDPFLIQDVGQFPQPPSLFDNKFHNPVCFGRKDDGLISSTACQPVPQHSTAESQGSNALASHCHPRTVSGSRCSPIKLHSYSPESNGHEEPQSPTRARLTSYNTSKFSRPTIMTDRYPVIVSQKHDPSAVHRKIESIRQKQNSRDYGTWSQQPARQGTFAAPFRGNRRSNNHQKQLPPDRLSAVGPTSDADPKSPGISPISSPLSYMSFDQVSIYESILSYDNEQKDDVDVFRTTRPIPQNSHRAQSHVGQPFQRGQSSSPALKLQSSKDVSSNKIGQTSLQAGTLNSPAHPLSRGCSSDISIESPTYSHASLLNGMRPRQAYNFYGPEDVDQVLALQGSPPLQKQELPKHGSWTSSHERASFVDQYQMAQARSSTRTESIDFCDSHGHHEASPQLAEPTSRHENIAIVSPIPTRPVSSHRSKHEFGRILSFEEYLCQETVEEGAERGYNGQILSTTSAILCRMLPVRKSSLESSRSIENTGTSAKKSPLSWPLPPHRVEQGSPWRRSRPRLSQTPLWRTKIAEENENSRAEIVLPATPVVHQQTTLQNALLLEDHGFCNDFAYARSQIPRNEKALSNPKNSSQSVLNPTSENIPIQDKTLPELPKDLDTSAITRFPLSSEVPLPEWVTTSNAVAKARRRNTRPPTPYYTPDTSPELLLPGSRAGNPPGIQTEYSTINSDPEEPSTLSNYKKSLEQSIPDAYVMCSENIGVDSNQPRYHWSGSSFGVERLRSTDETRRDETCAWQKRPRGCIAAVVWLRRKLDCGSKGVTNSGRRDSLS